MVRRSFCNLMPVMSAALLLLVLNGCGGSGAASSPATSATKKTVVQRTAGGDIPDTATYLIYHTPVYSIEYVEGWVLRGLQKNGVIASDIDSTEMVTVGARPSQSLMAYVRGPGQNQTAREYKQFSRTGLASVSMPAGSAVRLSFKAISAPDPITGKQVHLVVDRYFIEGTHHLATVTLSTPVGVDNVDAFRRIAHSFRWLAS